MKGLLKNLSLLGILFCALLISGCSNPSEAEVQSPAGPSDTTPTITLQPTITPTLTRLEIAQATIETKKSGQLEPGELEMPAESLELRSPDGHNRVLFGLVAGVPYYSVDHQGVVVIRPSKMGFTFAEAPALNADMTIAEATESAFDETWTQPWGEVKQIRDQHNELRIRLIEDGTNGRTLVIVFRAFNDGIGFRYAVLCFPG